MSSHLRRKAETIGLASAQRDVTPTLHAIVERLIGSRRVHVACFGTLAGQIRATT